MKTILGNMEFDTGFKKTDNIIFFNETKKIIIKLKAYFEKDGITEEQQDALKKYNDEKMKIYEKFTELARKYDETDYQRLTPKTLLFGRKGECALLCDDKVYPDEGIAICVFPREEIISQDDYL